MTDLQTIEFQVARCLDDYRMAHTRAVRDECLSLALLFDLSAEDKDLLTMAALLHDCTKQRRGQEQIRLAHEYGISLTADDIDNPATLHALTGARVAEIVFHAPSTVVNAIACHTTGRENMCLIDKLLFLADYIEPTRTFEDCLKVRKFFYEDCALSSPQARLDATLILAFDLTIDSLLREGKPIHPTTVKSRNFLLRKS